MFWSPLIQILIPQFLICLFCASTTMFQAKIGKIWGSVPIISIKYIHISEDFISHYINKRIEAIVGLLTETFLLPPSGHVAVTWFSQARGHHVIWTFLRRGLVFYVRQSPWQISNVPVKVRSAVSMTTPCLLLQLSSSSFSFFSSTAVLVCVVAVMGLAWSILSGVGEGTSGRSFCIIEQAKLETPWGSFRHKLDYPWGLFNALDVTVGGKKKTTKKKTDE